MKTLIAFSDSCRINKPIPVTIIGGVVFDMNTYREFGQSLRDLLKNKGLEEIKLKNLSPKGFEEYADFLGRFKFTCFITMIDEQGLKMQYVYPDDPMSFAYELLVERFGKYAQRNKAYILVVHDEENVKKLRERVDKLKNLDFDWIFCCKRTEFNHIIDTIFTTVSHRCPGIQLADTVAEVGKIIIKSYLKKQELPKRQIIDQICDKLDRIGRKIEGYGFKIYPTGRLNPKDVLDYVQFELIKDFL